MTVTTSSSKFIRKAQNRAREEPRMTLRGRNGTYDRVQPRGAEATEQSRSGLPLRRRLLLLVLMSVVPLLSFSFALQFVQYRKEIAATGRQTLEIARSLSA